MIASGSDALFDSILSLSVFISAIIFITFGLSLESYVGLVISVFVIKASIEMILSTIDDLIGHRSDPEMVKKIEGLVKEE